MSTTIPRAYRIGDPRKRYHRNFCSGRWSISTTTGKHPGIQAEAHPTRHLSPHGSFKFHKGDLFGQVFATSDEAFDAMYARGYGEPSVSAWCPVCRVQHFCLVFERPGRDGKLRGFAPRSQYCKKERAYVSTLWKRAAEAKPNLP